MSTWLCTVRHTNRRATNLKLALTVIAVIASLAGCAPHAETGGNATAAISSGKPSLLPDGYLSTSGAQVVDENGSPVRLACVGYGDPTNLSTDMPAIVAAGFNCVRYAWFNGTLGSDLANIDAIVAGASQVGIKVILDHHGDEVPGPNNGWLPFPCNGLPFDSGPGTNGTDDCGDQGTVTEQRYVSDWVTVAGRYAYTSTVIGVDLTNEPHLAPTYWASGGGGATWGDGSATDIRAIYSEVGNAIQAVNPGLLLICEGPFAQTGTLYNGQTAIGGPADLSLAGSNPVTVGIAGKVVYSVHEYPKTIGGQDLDSGPTKVQGMNAAWGYLVAQNIAPVWIGEMGASLDGVGPDSQGDGLADEQAWAATLVAYINGADGDEGGPTFSGNQQPIGTDWWAWGSHDDQLPDGTLLGNGQLRPEQYAVYSQLAFVASNASPPAAAPAAGCTASPDGAVVTAVGPTLCDGAGNAWAIASDGTMTMNGATVQYSANVIELAYVGGVIWQENASNLWWSYVGGAWAPEMGTTTSPVPAVCTPSPDGATVTGVGPTLCDASGNVWAIASDGTMTKNGATVQYSANVIELAYVSGVLWQENASALWWAYDSGGWTPPLGTSTSPLP